MAAFLANVGVNASHRVRSRLRVDGGFELLPIPERVGWAPPMLRLPEVWGLRAVHLDPDLRGRHPTYGDNCRTAGRAFALRRAERDDVIVFLARLHSEDGAAGFHLVGALEIARVRRDLARDPGPGWWDDNAHVRRARATGEWDSFWVFEGTARSRLFRRAVPFTREIADALFPTIFWRPQRTELQTIGSHTRAVRRLTGATEELLRSCCRS